MHERSQKLLNIRPQLPNSLVHDRMGQEEHFQNGTLRPVLKLQNSLMLRAFQNYIEKHKNQYHTLSLGKRIDYIANAIQKDLKFRNSLKGMVIGQFTLEEYETYLKNSSALNKRMMNMVIARLQDQMQYFDAPLLN